MSSVTGWTTFPPALGRFSLWRPPIRSVIRRSCGERPSALGVAPGAAAVAQEANLLDIGTTVRFRHPLVRSAVYRSLPAGQRQAAHRALAEASDPVLDPDRRAWHRAQATASPDEDVAAELERSAGRAQRRGGVAAAAAFLDKAFQLTPEPARRAERALAAAQAKVQSGATGEALRLLVLAEAGPLTEADRARADLVRAQAAFASNRGNDASPLMVNAARRLERVDVELARVTYLDALNAALFAGQLARPEANLRSVSRAALTLPAPRSPSTVDLLLEGWPAISPRTVSARATRRGCRSSGAHWRTLPMGCLPNRRLAGCSWLMAHQGSSGTTSGIIDLPPVGRRLSVRSARSASCTLPSPGRS